MVYDTFAAANTAKGFFSYFDELINNDTLKRVYLIKGGPGCGKSTLMKKLAERLEKDGCTVERIHCSSDVSSLDGVFSKDKKILIIDATPPHSYDMQCPGAYESLIDLSQFWDERALADKREEICAIQRESAAVYRSIYGLIRAAGASEQWRMSMLDEHTDKKQICSLVKKLIKQNAITPVVSTPKCENRILSALTDKGVYIFDETPEKLCDEFIVFEDNAWIAHLPLLKTAVCFSKMGYDTMCIRSPLFPECRIEQVIIPQLRLGFVADGHLFSSLPCENKIIKNVNTRCFIDKDFYTQNKNKLTFSKRMTGELIRKTSSEFSRVRELHNRLESYYTCAMDFAALNRYTSELIDEIASIK